MTYARKEKEETFGRAFVRGLETHAQPGTFDAIVIGVGGMGSAACLEFARRGRRVLGLEQFSLVHDRGSSHGESRIIRKAYFEHPDYVPLLHRAYELWHKLEQAAGRKLLSPTGLVLSGLPDGETICGARLAAEQHRLELQNMMPDEAHRRFPAFRFPEHHEVAFEPIAGTLSVEDCVRAQINQAIQLGAEIHENESVRDWNSDGTTVCVRTATCEYRAHSLVVTCGAWANQLLQEHGLPLRVVRKFVGWFGQQNPLLNVDRGCPTYFFELPHGSFYGFPSFDGATIKIAEHSGGQPVSDPSNVDRDCYSSDLDRLQSFIADHFQGVERSPQRHSVCLYTVTPDHHFVIDRHPDWKNVAFAAGFSGHGFKFCPVIGEILADLIERGTTTLPIEFLSCSRQGLISDPGAGFARNK